jgi:hypothetical protein
MLEIYHPLLPAVPVVDMSMEGVVVSIEMVVEEVEIFPAMSCA